MDRLVLCKDTKERISADKAYRTVRISKNGKEIKEIWSSKEGCELYRRNIEYKDKINIKVKELLGYSGKKTNLPSAFYIGLEEFKEYGFETVYEFICQKSDSFIYAASNWNDTQPKLMRYCLGIIRNGINPFYKQKIEYEKITKQQASDPVFDEMIIENRTKSTKDISKFLEE